MLKKMGIASLTTILIFIGVWMVYNIFELSYAEANKSQMKSASEGVKYSDYIESYELKNTLITSKENLKKGYNLIFNEEKKLEMMKYVPSIKIKFKKEVAFVGYIMDPFKNIICKTRVYPSDIEKGKAAGFYWDSICWALNNDIWNGEYYFYIELYDENDLLISVLKSRPIELNIPNNNLPKGFYIYSPPLLSFSTGLHAIWNMEKQPIVAWVDTTNKEVVKYQLFDATPSLNPGLKPIINNIPPNIRQINVDKKLLKIDIKNPPVKGPEGFYAFVVRAVFKNGSYVDSEDSGPVEFFEKREINKVYLK